MTATQTLKIYQILHKHFKNEEEASLVVKEIEELVDKKIDQRKETLSTKEDIYTLKMDISGFRIEMEKRFNQMIVWTVSTGIATVGLVLAF